MKSYIIVGAGILGATTAYRLAKSGAKVTVIDKPGIGQATEAAAGIICPWLSQRRNKKWYHLAKSGAKMYPELVQELMNDGQIETGYAQVGALSLHKEEKKLLAMQERALKRREDAPEIGEVTLLNASQTKELVPLIDGGYSSVLVSGGAKLDGQTFRSALLNAAQKYGAKVIDGTATLYQKDNQVLGVYVEKERYEADQVIATCGAWMNELLAPLGINFQSTGQKGQLIHLELPGIDSKNWPVIMPPTNQSVVPFENHIVIGATHENDKGFDLRVTAGGVQDILTKALDVLPQLADSTLLETRVGFRPFTPDFLPVIGPIPGVEGLLVANGLGSSGLTTGPFVGTQLAKLALDEAIEISLEDYDVSGAIE
ncbi:NAD(P)/FAD-dependent oxidoreductase [Ornithinibacillus californiensis]|uniref:NAD(P)/FAD-dependent oxidoreductase n=1 Tax=Ornithinibacillus californiensis TaxID=161536 RepID=UPI00064DEA79|nr:FAD-binding oxidoreductase [Ornithinibacillus californiensis]